MKHTVKRTTAAILAALILAGTAAAAATFAAPTIAHATEPLPATSGSCGATASDNVTWSFDSETKTLTISGTGDMKGYNIINGVAQNLPWENYRTSIEKVVIESEITEIGFGSFAGHTNLTEVIFAENSKLKKIGGSAFSGCTGLTSVTIPEDVTSISQDAFYGCTGLTNITIPEKVNSIGMGAFYTKSPDAGLEEFRKIYSNYNIVSCEAVFYEQTGWHIYLKMWKKEPKKAGQGGKRSGNRKKNKAAPDIKA